jgi:phospholipid transport system substrate-binding protein
MSSPSNPTAARRLFTAASPRTALTPDVGTKVINDRGEESPSITGQSRGAEWKAYDVIIENISIVNNYRSQFVRILGRSSFAELLQTIRDKVR